MRELAPGVRNSSLWTTARARRDIIPRYSNSLARVETRPQRCKTCGKAFGDVRTMERHVSLTHTGAKPVMCPVCDKRFDSQYHMMSHYPIHRQSNLSQVEPFNRRRRGLTEPVTSQTSVGSIHGISRRFKHYLSEPTFRTFGTGQTFNVSGNESRTQNKQKSLKLESSGSKHAEDYKELSGWKASSGQSGVNVKRVDRIPKIDPGSISSVDSVMGGQRKIQTNERSGFLKSAEDRLINDRLEAMSLAGWTVSTPLSGTRPSFSRGTKITF